VISISAILMLTNNKPHMLKCGMSGIGLWMGV